MQSASKETIPSPEPSLVFPARQVLGCFFLYILLAQGFSACRVWTGEPDNPEPLIDLRLCFKQTCEDSFQAPLQCMGQPTWGSVL